MKSVQIQDLIDSANAERIKNAVALIERVKAGQALLPGEDGTIIKCGTTLTVAFILKLKEGKLPVDFSAADWIDIADHVSTYAIFSDEKTYSAYVFMLYAAFIDESLIQFGHKISNEKRESIHNLSTAIKEQTSKLDEGIITETGYIEECLWICLDAMMKLVACTIDTALGFEKDQVVEAAASLMFEFGRYIMYKKEQKILAAYLDNQKLLDGELQRRFDEYVSELNAITAQFEILLQNAFSEDFRTSLTGTIELARASGVGENEILKSLDEIDDYFM